MTNDDVCNCNKSQDYLTLPTFDFSGQPAMGLQFQGYDDGRYGQNPSTIELNINSGGWNVIYTFAQMSAWQTIRLPLVGTTGQSSIEIRFRYDDAGSWATGLAIDDLVIYNLPDNDLSMNSAVGQTIEMDPWLTPLYTRIPVRQTGTITFAGRVSNAGALSQTNTILTADVTKGLNTKFNSSSTPLTLTSGQDSMLSIAPTMSFNPTDTGTWALTFTASSDSVDDFPSDNVVNRVMDISDTIFQRDDNIPTWQFNAASFGLINPYRFANLYETSALDTATSITIMLGPGTIIGTPVQGQIYDDALPTPALLATTGFHTVTAADTFPNFLTLQITGGFETQVNTNYLVAVEEFAGNDSAMRVVTTAQNSPGQVPGYLYARQFPNPVQWWTFGYTPFIRLNFASSAKGCIDSLSVISTDATCGGACDGSATVTVNGGNTPFTYEWDDPALQTNAAAASLCQGSYQIKVTDTYGCVSFSGISVTDGSSMGLTMATTDESCGNSDGTATVTGSGGTLPYTYLWDDPGTQTTQTVVGLSASSYNVTVFDDNNCQVATDFFSAAVISNIPPPTSNAGNDTTICATDNVMLNGSIGSSATSSTWSTSGSGTFNNTALLNATYTPSNADTTAGSVILIITTDDPDGAGSCLSATDIMVLTFNSAATVSAGNDDAICAGSTYLLSGSRGGASSSSTWSTLGTGSYDNVGITAATYTPSVADITAGTVTLTITTDDPVGPCGTAVDTMTLTINPVATASAGADATICEGGTHTLTGSRGGSATSSTWSTSGTGSFDNASLLTVTYTPSATDISSGTVNLTIMTDDPDGAGPCSAGTDFMVLTINPAATVSAGADTTICEGNSYTLSGTRGGGASSSAWSTSGSGTFDNTALLAATYTPSSLDITVGTVSLTLTTDNPAGPCNGVSDIMVLTIDQAATTGAGADATICEGNSYGLSGSFGGSAASITWSSSGTGVFTLISDPSAIYTPSATDIIAGSVNLTITSDDPTGPCGTATDFMVLTIDPAATASAGSDATICEGSTHTLAGSRGGSATSSTWTTSGTGIFSNASIVNPVYTPSAVDISAGTVTLTITTDDPTGPCLSASDNMTLTIDQSATASAGGDANICEGSTHTTAGSRGGSASSSTWSSSGTGSFNNTSLLAATYTPSVADILLGTVTLTITTDDPTGPCTAASDTMLLTINAIATVSAGSDATICEGVSHTLAGSRGGSAISSTWSTSGTGTFDNSTLLAPVYTPSAADILAGSVTLAITTNDPSGPCTAASDNMTLTINVKDDPAFTYSSGTFCQTGTDPVATISGTGGGVFSESSGDIVFLNTSTGEIDLSASTLGGPYTVQYTTGGICPDSSTVSITITTAPDATFSYAGPYCQDGTNPLPTFGMGASAGIFSATPAGLVFVNASTGEIDLAASTDATYTVTNFIASSGGCSSSSANNSVTINLAATVSAGADATICEGDLITLSGSRGGSASSSTWTSSGTGTFDNATIVGATYTASPADIIAGTVTLTITTDDPTGPCDSVSDDMILIINTAATTSAGADANVCEGSDHTLSGAIGGSTSSLTWTSSGSGGFDNANLAGATYTPSAADITAGTVDLTITTDDPTGPCNAVNDVMTLTIDPIPTVTAGVDDTICEGGTVSLTGAIGGGASSISWTSSGTGTFDDTTLLTATYTPSPLDITVGTVTLVITSDDPGGPCNAATDNLLLTINSSATTDAGVNTIICDGDIYLLSGSMGGGASSITWTSSGTGTFDNATLLAATYTPSPADITGGTVTLTITTDDPDGAGPCVAANDQMVITINAAATAIAGSDATICAGEDHTLAGSMGGSATTVTWTTSGNGTYDNANLETATYTPSAGDIAAGTVVLTMITDDPAGSCLAASDNLTLTIVPALNIDTEIKLDVTCNNADDGSITITASGGAGVMTYSVDNGSTYQSSGTFINLPPGSYTIVVLDSSGCSVTGSTYVITEPAAIVLSTSSIDENCGSADGEVSVATSGGTGPLTVLWDDPSNSTNNSVTGLSGNTYIVIVTDSNGCTETDTAIVLNQAAGVATATLVNDATCKGDCDGEATSAMSGGLAPFTYAWDDPGSQTTASATALCAGVATVTITDANNCVATDAVTIVEPAAIVINVTPNDALLGTCNGSATVTVTGGSGSLSYLWDDGQTSTIAISLCPGPITVVVTDSAGCKDSATTNIDTYTGVTGINAEENLNIYPNPSGGLVIIDFNNQKFEDVIVKVYDKIGELVSEIEIEKTNSDKVNMDLSTLANGLYFIHVTTESGTIVKRISIIK